MNDSIAKNQSTPQDSGKKQTTRMRQGKLEDIPKVSAIASAYLGEETLDNAIIERWFNANNEVLKIIECDHNPHTQEKQWHVCGYYILLPLIGSFAELIKKDAIPHEDIPASAIQDYSNPEVSSVFFIDLMAHYPICKGKYCGQVAATRIFYDLAHTLNGFTSHYPHIQEIIAMPMTKESKVMTKRFGFLKDPKFKSHPGWELWTIPTDKLAEQAPNFIKRMASRFESILN